jgi:hypothetical protein
MRKDMMHLHSTASVKFALICITLITAAGANASLLDCTKSMGMVLASGAGAACAPIKTIANTGQANALKKDAPASPIKAAGVSFQVDQTRATSAVPESAPLLVLVGVLLAVALIRTKSCNTK